MHHTERDLDIETLNINSTINPRQGAVDVSDLVAQITANGFNQRIWVRENEHGQFDVMDGKRRVLALQHLIAQGRSDTLVPVLDFTCTLEQAQELALAANVVRNDLSPADEAEAFYRLKLSGLADDVIAARFAIPVRRVQQRAAIGALPPELLNALRAGQLGLEQAQAYTISTSPARQLALFNAQPRASANAVRSQLLNEGVWGTDYRAQFVGQAAYEQQGGSINADLFSENIWFNDETVLQRLFDEKLASTIQSLKDEGWSFVDVNPKNKWSYGLEPPKGKITLRDDQKLDLAQLTEKQKALASEIDAKEDDDDYQWTDDDNGLTDQLQALDDQIATLSQAPFTDKQKKKLGVLIAFGEYDNLRLVKGSSRPEKQGLKPAATAAAPAAEDDDEPAPPAVSASYSDVVDQILIGAARDATKLAMVTTNQVMAYRMGLAARLLSAVGRGHEAPFQGIIRPTDNGMNFTAAIAKAYALQETASFAELIAALELLQPDQIIQLEAYLAASQLNFSSLKSADVRCVLEAIAPDMGCEGFSVDEAFLARLSRDQLTAIALEIDPTAKASKGKKPDMVASLLPRIKNSAWLPEALRSSLYQGPGSATYVEAQAAAAAAKIMDEAA